MNDPKPHLLEPLVTRDTCDSQKAVPEWSNRPLRAKAWCWECDCNRSECPMIPECTYEGEESTTLARNGEHSNSPK
jgi:hypothetical protein